MEVQAGEYEQCKVYNASKTMNFGAVSYNAEVKYFINASSPVPVKYSVETIYGKLTYELNRLYTSKDIDNSPEGHL